MATGGKKGQRKGKKTRYLANKAGASAKGKNSKKTGGFKTAKLIAIRQAKHKELLQVQSGRSMQRANMLEEVHHKFSDFSHSKLRHMFGTLNIHRMTDILNDSYFNAAWYKNRNALAEAKQVIVKQVVRHGKFFSKKNKKLRAEKSGKVSTVPDSTNEGN